MCIVPYISKYLSENYIVSQVGRNAFTVLWPKFFKAKRLIRSLYAKHEFMPLGKI